MVKEPESFWGDIKKYEDTLARDPASYCFAPLAELYRRVGMLDDSINLAKRGIEIHPEYVGGFLALGRSCYDKGLKDEARAALERVTRVTPDNLQAQKLLSQLYIDSGESSLAKRTLEIILDLNPDDTESRVSLEALQLAKEPSPLAADGFFPEEPADAQVASDIALEDDLIEDADIIEELDDEVFFEEEDKFASHEPVVCDDLAAAHEDLFPDDELPTSDEKSLLGQLPAESYVAEDVSLPVESERSSQESDKDPLTTITLAELYESQGFLKRALKIYRDLLDGDPENAALRSRLVELKNRIDADEVFARANALQQAAPYHDTVVAAELSEPLRMVDQESGSSRSSSSVEVLESCLENIRRIRQCRSGNL